MEVIFVCDSVKCDFDLDETTEHNLMEQLLAYVANIIIIIIGLLIQHQHQPRTRSELAHETSLKSRAICNADIVQISELWMFQAKFPPRRNSQTSSCCVWQAAGTKGSVFLFCYDCRRHGYRMESRVSDGG
jgi:hypothetical protein